METGERTPSTDKQQLAQKAQAQTQTQPSKPTHKRNDTQYTFVSTVTLNKAIEALRQAAHELFDVYADREGYINAEDHDEKIRYEQIRALVHELEEAKTT